MLIKTLNFIKIMPNTKIHSIDKRLERFRIDKELYDNCFFSIINEIKTNATNVHLT